MTLELEIGRHLFQAVLAGCGVVLILRWWHFRGGGRR
jgi:hypothetical protein